MLLVQLIILTSYIEKYFKVKLAKVMYSDNCEFCFLCGQIYTRGCCRTKKFPFKEAGGQMSARRIYDVLYERFKSTSPDIIFKDLEPETFRTDVNSSDETSGIDKDIGSIDENPNSNIDSISSSDDIINHNEVPVKVIPTKSNYVKKHNRRFSGAVASGITTLF